MLRNSQQDQTIRVVWNFRLELLLFFAIYIAHNIIIYFYYVFTDLVYSAVVIEIIIDIIAQYLQYKIAGNKAAPTSTV